MASGTTRSEKQVDSSGSRAGSRELFERAERILVGGVNSPVRAFRSVGGTPLVIDRARDRGCGMSTGASTSIMSARGAR